MASNAPVERDMTVKVVDGKYITFGYMQNTGEPCDVRISLDGLRNMHRRAKWSVGRKAVAGPISIKMRKER